MQPTSPWLCALSDFDLLRISGKDAPAFLNAQLSNDVAHVSRQTSQLSSYCSPKGRVYCTFRIFSYKDGYCLRTTTGVIDEVMTRLKMFVLRSRTVLEKDTELGGIALLGNGSSELLNAAGLSLPATASQVSVCEDYHVILSPGICERYEIYAPYGTLSKLWHLLLPDTVFVTDGVWRLHDIFSGIPNIYPETSESFIPQMINLDLIDAVSFSKGCYPGQEVVARTHYRGKLKRRMYRFISEEKSSPFEPGIAMFVPDCDNQQPVGKIVDVYKLPNGKIHGLATLRMQNLDRDEIRMASPDGDIAHIVSLPYGLDGPSRDEV